MIRSVSVTAIACFAYTAGAFAGPTNEELTKDFRLAIHDMLRDPADATHGIANENSGEYGHSIEVTWTGPTRESVEKQIKDTAEAALRVGTWR